MRHNKKENTLLSVIIPVLNEEKSLAETLTAAKKGADVEVIVVDGGSWDSTRKIAEKFGVRLFDSLAGRARQLNKGAQQAKGEIYLFVHGDTILPENYDRYVRQAMTEKGVAAGAFNLSIDSMKRRLKWVAWAANMRSRLFQLPYGDQALFTRASLFREMGGFPDLPVMEDFSLVRRIKKRGQIRIVAEEVKTSARRWQAKGVIQTTLINQMMVIGFLIGLSPDLLAKLYGVRKNG